MLNQTTFEQHLETSTVERFAEIVNWWKPLSFFVKCSILNVWQGFEYNSESLWLLHTKYTIGIKDITLDLSHSDEKQIKDDLSNNHKEKHKTIASIFSLKSRKGKHDVHDTMSH